MDQQGVQKLWRERKYLFKAVLVAAVLGLFLSFLIPGQYSSTARIIPPQQIQSSLSSLLGQMGAVGFTGLMALRNPSDVYISLLRSDTVAKEIAQRFALEKHYGVDTFEDVQNKLDNRSQIRAAKEGVVIIRITDRDADVAASLANGYVEELHKLVQKLALEETAQRKRFMESKLVEVMQSLEIKETAFRTMQETIGAVRVDGQVDITFATMGGLRANIMMREVALHALSNSVTKQNSSYRAIEAEIAGLRAELQKLEQSPLARNPKYVIAAEKGPQLAMEYARRLRDLRYEEAMYQVIWKQYELVRMEESKGFQQFLVVDIAKPATKRDFPTQPMIVLFTVVLGLCMAIYLIVTDNVWYPSELWRKNEGITPS